MKWNAILDSIAWESSQTTGQRSEVVSVESVLALVVDLHLFEAPASVPASVGGSSITPASYLHLLEAPVKFSDVCIVHLLLEARTPAPAHGGAFISICMLWAAASASDAGLEVAAAGGNSTCTCIEEATSQNAGFLKPLRDS